MDTKPRFRPTEWASTVRIRGHILAYFGRDGGYRWIHRIHVGYASDTCIRCIRQIRRNTVKYLQNTDRIHAGYRQNTHGYDRIR